MPRVCNAWLTVGLFACAAVCVAGCGGSAPPSKSDAASAADLANVDLASSGGMLCTDPEADAWVLPITKTSAKGSFKVSLMSGNYSPPIIGVNTWQFIIEDASGAPISNAMLSVKPWMPYMGHGTSVVPITAASSEAGAWSVSELYLFMAGVWTTTLTITDGTTTDTVVYGVCLAS